MKIIYRVIVGSQSYGTATPESDVDHKFVYMQDVDDLISFGYKEQINVNKDDTGYEIRRFLELLQTGNPTVLEMLYSPEDCIVIKDPVFDILIANRDKFLTKKCMLSFGGYAIAQIQKARGLDKKMNWEMERVKRRTPIDFIYSYENGKTIPIHKWLETHNKKQECCGLVALDHFRDCYALYYDKYNHNPKFYKYHNIPTKDLNYRGLALDDSNSIRLSSVPKGEEPLTIIYYNKDGYSTHCKDYKEYQDWLANRNNQRFVDNVGHNQKIDSKNLLHTRRLLDMAMEIAKTGMITVRRPNAEYLLQIRRGEVSLNDIISQAEEDIKLLDQLFKDSNLPNSLNNDFVNDLLLEMRHGVKVRKLTWLSYFSKLGVNILNKLRSMIKFILLLLIMYGCTEAGTTYLKLNGNENTLPPELKGLKVYKVYLDKDNATYVGILNNEINSLNYRVGKNNENIILLNNIKQINYTEIVSETKDYIIIKK